jgi:hypothetical protein
MSWKTETIFIRPARLDGGPEKLVTDLGYQDHRKISETPISGAGVCSVWIGAAGDCVIIYTRFAAHFFGADDDEEFNSFRSALLRHFSDADITPLFLDNRSGAWGFAVFRHGTLIRCQYGEDGAAMDDEGARLPAEEAHLARFERRKVNGEVLYRDSENPGAGDLTVSDVGCDLVVEMFQSFTGLHFDDVDGFGIGANFWLNEKEQERYSRSRAGLAAVYTSSSVCPWWKFWG